MKKIAVVGSINTDFVFSSKHLPKPSETIKGDSFNIYFGGKGANVSVAAARLGNDVKIFGAVGDDIHSSENVKNLQAQNVDTKNLTIIKGEMGGSACITMGDDTNSIIVVPGANGKYNLDCFKKDMKEILDCDVVATQLEIPFETVETLIDEVYKANKVMVFNPSPIRDLKQDLLDKCSYIIVNEVEIRQLPGFETEEQMLKKYNGKLILTKGSQGAFYYDNGKVENAATIKTKVVNTTGAGDTFLAAFSVAIVEGKKLSEAIKFANLCAGIKVSKEGTQTGMPTREEVDNF